MEENSQTSTVDSQSTVTATNYEDKIQSQQNVHSNDMFNSEPENYNIQQNTVSDSASKAFSASTSKLDAYDIQDYRSPRAKELLNLAQQYKRFEVTDIYMIIGVFLIGFVFAFVLSNYYKLKKEKIQEINKQFQGLKGEYEQVQKSLGKYISWKYRVKIAEKIFYVLLLSLGFLFYKSPSLMSYTFTEIPHYSIPFFTVLIMGFNLVGMQLDKKEKAQEKRHLKLKEQLKDTKRLLISHMDPVMVQTIKEIIKKDMRREIEAMKNSDEGCSQKCRLTNEMLKKDLGRNKVIVSEFISFKWCETCQNPQPGAVQVCHSGCGQKVFKRCLPLMKEYGEMEKDIQSLKQQIQEISEASLKFSEFQKAKRELEFDEVKKKSMTFSMIDKSLTKGIGSVAGGSQSMRNSQQLQ